VESVQAPPFKAGWNAESVEAPPFRAGWKVGMRKGEVGKSVQAPPFRAGREVGKRKGKVGKRKVERVDLRWRQKYCLSAEAPGSMRWQGPWSRAAPSFTRC